MRKKIPNLIFEKFSFFVFLLSLALVSAPQVLAQTIISDSGNILEIKASSSPTNSTFKFLPSTSTNSFSLQGIANPIDPNSTISIFEYLSSTSLFKMLNGTLNYNPSNNRIGIGMTDPQQKFSVGSASSDYIQSYGGFIGNPSANIGGTGDAAYFPEGIYSAKMNWLYGGVAMNNGSLSNVGSANFSGNVGIGTASPNYKLDVAYHSNGVNFNGNYLHNVSAPSTTTDAINKGYLDSSLETYGSKWILSGSNLYPSSTAWNVGIGTNNPSTKLDIRDVGPTLTLSDSRNLAPWLGTELLGGLDIYTSDGSTSGGRTGVGVIGGIRSYNVSTNNIPASDLRFYTSLYNEMATERMRITNSGNVGIGTDAPGAFRLFVNGATYTSGNLNVGGDATISGGDVSISNNNGGINFNDASAYWLKTATNYGIYWDTTANQFKFNGAGVTKASIDLDDGAAYFNGSVGIGTNAPSAKLTVSGGNIFITDAVISSSTPHAAVTKTYLDSAIQALASTTSYWTANGTHIFNTNTGNVGVGTSNPGQQLEITKNFRLPATVGTSAYGVIYKDGDRFIHDFNYGLNGNGVTTSGGNTFVGINAGNLTMGSTATSFSQSSSNTGVGYYSLFTNTTGYGNSALGYQTLLSNTTGNSNSALGYLSLSRNTTGYSNSALGYLSLENNTTGGNNSALGYSSLRSNTTGGGNSAFGYDSLVANSTGSLNSAFGDEAGKLLATGGVRTTGDLGLYLGYSSKASADGTNNEIVIGALAVGNGSNTVTLGNNSISKTILKGNVGIGTAAPEVALDVNGLIKMRTSNITTTSDVINKGYLDSALLAYGSSNNFWKLNGSNLYASSTDWNVGIGTTAPEGKLHLRGEPNFKQTITRPSGGFAFYMNDLEIDNDNGKLTLFRQGAYGSADTPSMGYFFMGADSDTTYNNNAFRLYPGKIANFQGNVGIGTTAPGAYRLFVNGATYTSGNLNVGGDATITGGDVSISNNNGGINFNDASAYWLKTATNYGIYWDTTANQFKFNGAGVTKASVDLDDGAAYFNGSVGIGAITPSAKLHVVGNSYFNGSVSVKSASQNAVVNIYGVSATTDYGAIQVSNLGDLTNPNNRALILQPNAGNVGIGKTNPTHKLHVAGDASFSDNQIHGVSAPATGTDAANRFYVDGLVTDLSGQIAGLSSYWTANGTNIYNNNTGNVGIGISAPLAKLQINNEAAFNTLTPGPAAYYGLHFGGQTTADYATGITWSGGTSGTQAGIYVQGSGSYGSRMYFATTNSYATGAQTRMMIDQSGNVGIGTTAPGAYKLYVNGATYTSGNLNTGGNLTVAGDAIISGSDVYDNSGDLHLSGEDSLYFKMDYNNDDADTRNIIFAKNTALGTVPTGVNELMRITETGNVSIGDIIPAYKLDVKGEGNFGNSQVHGVSAPSSDTDAANQGYVKSSVEGFAFWKLAGSNLYASSTTWNVGIGNNAPAQKLDVTGSINSSAGYKVNNSAVSGNYLRGNGSNFVASTIQAGDVPTLNQNTSGYAGYLMYEDNRSISPSELARNMMKFGFTSYKNNNSAPWADFLHFRSYGDSSAGNDNLLVFNKTALGMRLYQEVFGSASPYTKYKDVVLAENTPAANYLTKYSTVGDEVTIAASSIYDNGTYIGIGTATPTSKLHVVGSSYLNGTIKTALTGTGSRCLHVDANGVIGTMAGDCGTSTGGDNLGNHTATENIKLGNNWLSGDGGLEGVFVKSNGDVTIGNINGLYGNSSLNFSVDGGGSIDSMGQMVLEGVGPVDIPAPLTLNLSGGSITAGGTIYNTNASYWLRFDNTLTDSLRVQGDLNTTGILKSTGTGANYMMGKLGIGTTNPASTARVTIDTPVASSSILFRAAGADKAILSFKNGIFLGEKNLGTYSGSNSIGIGQYALDTGSGHYNVAIGQQALQLVGSGSYNVAVGRLALGGNSVGGAGSSNIAIGYNALFSNTVGSNNIAIGDNSLNFGGKIIGNNNISIGNRGSWVSGSSNKLYIGDLDIYSTHIPLIYGDMTSTTTGAVGIKTTNLQSGMAMTVAGKIYADDFIYSSSDARLKHDIKNLSEIDYQKILKLRPVSFTYNKNNSKGFGFIAQELEKLYPEMVETNESDGMKSVTYDNLISPTIMAIQEQQKKIEEQETLIQILLDRVNKLENSTK